jgi:hypothetical protein
VLTMMTSPNTAGPETRTAPIPAAIPATTIGPATIANERASVTAPPHQADQAAITVDAPTKITQAAA